MILSFMNFCPYFDNANCQVYSSITVLESKVKKFKLQNLLLLLRRILDCDGNYTSDNCQIYEIMYCKNRRLHELCFQVNELQ